MRQDARLPVLAGDHLRRYGEEGYLYLPRFIAPSEIEPLSSYLTNDPAGRDRFHTVGPLDYVGWTEPEDDLIGVLSRLSQLVEVAETLIGEPCYHYHTKLVRKPPGREQRLEWHQDFGSWYKDGCLSPDMLTCVVALTPACLENGCLQFLKGSHRLGRLDRVSAGHESYTYFSLNPPRLEAIEARYEARAIEMSPGDLLIFHANTLHASGSNLTNSPRILFEVSYNALSNPPVFDGQAHHRARPLEKVPNAVLRERSYRGLMERTRLIDIDDDDDPGAGVFRRRHDPGLC